MEIPFEIPSPSLKIHCIHSPQSHTYTYLIASTIYPHNAIIIDPLLSRDPPTNALNTTSPDLLLDIISKNHYSVEHILETHAPAGANISSSDGNSSSSATWYLRTQLLERTGYAPRISVKESLNGIREIYARKYGVRRRFWKGEFDGRFVDGEVLSAGALRIRVVHLPLSSGGGGGRGDKHVGYVVDGQIFMGECLFHAAAQRGSGGDEEVLRKSRERILSLPGGSSLRMSTTRGCPGSAAKDKGCVGELREEHAAAAAGCDVVKRSLGGGLDEGLVA